MLAWLFHAALPAWLAWLAMIRVFGILNKELGVVLFGRCKITHGRLVAATGRTIVLALTNYFTAAFLMGFVYTKMGYFMVAGSAQHALDSSMAMLQSFSLQFGLGPIYPANGTASHWLVTFHAGFTFLFGLLVISLFVSLLDMRSESD